MKSSRSYPKGIAKREEILRTALEVVAQNGYAGTSVRQIGEAVGLTNAGLLHYFDSKDHLFAEILRTRDVVDTSDARFGTDALEAFLRIVEHNADVPGLVQLYSRLSAEAVDPAHDAHDYFVQHYDAARRALAESLRSPQWAGALRSEADADRLARLLLAASDGLQTQWLLRRDFDMAAELRYLIALV
jgi:AcrR family transcriptional regulator